MKIEKLYLPDEKVDVNLKFYFFLKYIVKLKPTYRQILHIIENINLFQNNINLFLEESEKIFINSLSKYEYIKEINLRINKLIDVELFVFSLRLYQIKNLLLEEAKMSESLDLNKLSELDPLSLEYDKISILTPYKTRVSGALLSLLFFEKLDAGKINFISQNAFDFIEELSKVAVKFKKQGLESNQIFMLMFNESINQSIISDSGKNYENRILSVLNRIGINNICKIHDKNDKSTEYDFFFEISGKTYGIGAKRTLRERYKQFIKTSLTSNIDVSIEITLGLDLNKEKARTIIQHGTYIFVADEIYKSREFCQTLNEVYSVKDLSMQTLQKLSK